MEKMFLDATSKTEDSAMNLQKMITDESAIFDILGDFFYHMDEAVRQAALEVYVRRAFISYDLNCLQHQRLPHSQSAVHFQFILPQSHPNRLEEILTARLKLKKEIPQDISHKSWDTSTDFKIYLQIFLFRHRFRY